MPDVVWAEESKNGLKFEIRPSYDDAPTTSPCQADGQSSYSNLVGDGAFLRVLEGGHLTLEVINRSFRTLVCLGVFLADWSILHAVNGIHNRRFLWNIHIATQPTVM